MILNLMNIAQYNLLLRCRHLMQGLSRKLVHIHVAVDNENVELSIDVLLLNSFQIVLLKCNVPLIITFYKLIKF